MGNLGVGILLGNRWKIVIVYVDNESWWWGKIFVFGSGVWMGYVWSGDYVWWSCVCYYGLLRSRY